MKIYFKSRVRCVFNFHFKFYVFEMNLFFREYFNQRGFFKQQTLSDKILFDYKNIFFMQTIKK